MSFGARLNQLRKKRGLSQTELAEMLNTKAPVIGRYERSEAKPSIDTASKLAKILGASLDYLVGHTALELDIDTLKRIEDVSKLPDDDRSFVLRTMDALIRDLKAQKAYAS